MTRHVMEGAGRRRVFTSGDGGADTDAAATSLDSNPLQESGAGH